MCSKLSSVSSLIACSRQPCQYINPWWRGWRWGLVANYSLSEGRSSVQFSALEETNRQNHKALVMDYDHRDFQRWLSELMVLVVLPGNLGSVSIMNAGSSQLSLTLETLGHIDTHINKKGKKSQPYDWNWRLLPVLWSFRTKPHSASYQCLSQTVPLSSLNCEFNNKAKDPWTAVGTNGNLADPLLSSGGGEGVCRF